MSGNPDFDQALRFLRLLDLRAEKFTFQTFHDAKPSIRRELARIIHAAAPSNPDLLDLYDQGAGAYVAINETDLKGRKTENITRIRAVWQEDDNGFQGALPLDPSLTVETSPTHHHRYWLVADEWPADTQGCADFIAIMDRMIASYASDRNVKDTARVLRLPGFVNRQHGVPHHVVRIVAATGRRYTRAEIIAAFPPILRAQKKTPPQHDWKPQGDELRRIHDALEYIDANDRNTWI